jgi:uncharacterized protein
MRSLLLAASLVLPLLAGCLAPPGPATIVGPQVVPQEVPEGAGIEQVAGGVAFDWGERELPFRASFQLPANVTIVRLVAEPPAERVVSVGMSNAETGRRRCNNPTVEDFSHLVTGRKTCSYLAAIDPPGATWNLVVSGTGRAEVRVELLNRPLDGLAAKLDLSQLSMPVHALQPTQTLFVPSFDGTRLRVEVTLPEGPGPWPAIIESSPYHDDGVRSQPASFAYFVKDWASRGYAVVVADVRGFGDSGGCVEVWGPNEQRDQAFLVEWTAQQPWSDGNVGFYGQSYVGTTPVEAAVHAPPHLKAIVTVAPVIRNYDDWHYGGVPNGESFGSPFYYMVSEDAVIGQVVDGLPPSVHIPNLPPPRGDPAQAANNIGNGLCNPADLARPNDPRALYDAYYRERDLGAMAANVKAAVLYTQGFEDANVKGAMIPAWFNAIQAPKLGLFGHWLHQHPPRMDQEVLFLGWMDQHVKGKPLGFEHLPQVDVLVDRATHRTADSWPTHGSGEAVLWPGFADGTLGPEPRDGAAALWLSGAGVAAPLGPATLALHGTLEEPVALAGTGQFRLAGRLTGAANGYLAAHLYDLPPGVTDPARGRLVTWGQVNLAHNADHTQYTPRSATERIATDLPLRPTEHIFPAGHGIALVLAGVPADLDAGAGGVGGATFTYEGGKEGTRLVLPTRPLSEYRPIPFTATP